MLACVKPHLAAVPCAKVMINNWCDRGEFRTLKGMTEMIDCIELPIHKSFRIVKSPANGGIAGEIRNIKQCAALDQCCLPY